MINLIKQATDKLKLLIDNAINTCISENSLPKEEIPEYFIEIPTDKTHGDFATNIAMVSAKAFKLAPRKIAELIFQNINLDDTMFEKCEIAGPGFINFYFSSDFYCNVLDAVNNDKDSYGRSDFGNNEKVMVEFVSANPTGPMHIGNARGGALGDTLASVLDWAGYDVSREFYVNDAGNQIVKFGLSLEARYLQIYKGEDTIPFPEDGYHGEDIKVRAKEFADIYGDTYLEIDSETRKKALIDYALPKNVEKLKEDLEKYRITYDKWFFESELHKNGDVDRIIQKLYSKNYIYENEGAIWYKAMQFGSEKDEVLIRGNGHPTYFAVDIAYHYNKFVERGFNKVINVWGADHHGHVARLKGSMNAIDLDGDMLDVVLMQLVRLIRDNEVVKVSKRTGKSITLSDLIDEVPIDAARFFFNLREPNSHLDFDLGLAVEQSSQNPVYYVQYAHARICSILSNLKSEGIEPRKCSFDELRLLNSPEEIELITLIAMLPNEVIEAAKKYDPAKITRYSIEIATLFHKFYNAQRVKGVQENLMYARLELCLCVKTVLNNVLNILKIDAPTSM